MKTAPWVNNLYPASLLFAYDLMIERPHGMN
jgi:hypothetical protein